MRATSRLRYGGALLLIAMLGLLAVAIPASADFGVRPDPANPSAPDFHVRVQDENGDDYAQAGGHPFSVTTSFQLNTLDMGGQPAPDGNMKDVVTDLPVGFGGNPQVAAECPLAALRVTNLSGTSPTNCPIDAQIGIATVRLTDASTPRSLTVPVYNMVPNKDQLAAFAFSVIGVPVWLVPTIRTSSDNGVRVTVPNVNSSIAVTGTTVTLWGDPGDPRHDPERGLLRFTPEGAAPIDLIPGGLADPSVHGPFLSLPVTCGRPPLQTIATFTSWQAPAVLQRYSAATPTGIVGCDRLRFAPTLAVAPDLTSTSTPTGLHVTLDVPQNDNPRSLATPTLKRAVVSLPPGVRVSPASADGLQGCSDEQIAVKTDSPVTCPDGAKIGTASLDTPLLAKPLEGSIYLGTPTQQQLLRLFLVVEGRAGLTIKLAGTVDPDPATGQLRATFDDNPQLPFGELRLDFKGGARAPLVTPKSCGAFSTHADLTAWSDQTVTRESPMTIDQGCNAAGRFEPTLSAGMVNPAAGGSSPFVLGIERPEGQQDVRGLTATLPPGVLAHVGDVPLCQEADAAAGTCPASSQVGTVTAAAGSGPAPLSVPQAGKARTAVHLAGPYKGAPYSLSIVVPAQAGPFDLGTVVVRAALLIDPVDAHVTVQSDPIPTILRGIPLDVRRIAVTIDRPGFMVSPTSCEPKSIGAVLDSTEGATAAPAVRFQVADCASLGYAPKLAIALTGKGQTKDGAHPALNARLTPPAGDANSKKVTVTLPLALALDPGNANGLCEPADAAKNKCPASTIVGSAQARSILPDPLRAPVYFVRGERIEKGRVRKTLPKLFIPLTADGVTVNVTGDSDVVGDRLVTTFANLPDAPFSTFDLNINGGQHGILAVSGTSVCAASNVADAEYAGQNGKTYMSKVTMGTPCALGVVKSSHTTTALKLTVGGVGAGKLLGFGNGVAKSSLSITSATTATLSLKLSKATRRALARGRDVKVKLKLAFTAKGQKKAKTTTKTVNLHGAKKR
jgi:hypothetical protein